MGKYRREYVATRWGRKKTAELCNEVTPNITKKYLVEVVFLNLFTTGIQYGIFLYGKLRLFKMDTNS